MTQVITPAAYSKPINTLGSGGPAIFPMRAAYGQSQSSSTPQTQTGMFGQSCMIPYYAVRISYRMLGGNGPATGFKAIIAATDDTGTRDFVNPAL